MNGKKLVARCALMAVVCSAIGGAAVLAADPEFAAPTVVTDFYDFGGDRRAFGLAVADFDEDDVLDVVASFVNGNVAFVKGNGDGTFQPKTVFPWKQTFFNGWAFTAADVNDDGYADLVWGATANSGPVSDGDVRAFLGDGNGTFQLVEYLVNGVSHNAGILLLDVGEDVGSVVAGDLDGDMLDDLVVGAEDAGDTVVTVLFNLGGSFTAADVFRRDKTISLTPPIWWAPPGTFGTTRDTIWGLALADTDGDGDLDLWLGDRALYLYRYLNDGLGSFTLAPPTVPPLPTRPEVYLPHLGAQATGYSPSMAAGDLNGDEVPDFVLGLQQGAQLPSSGVAHDGELIIDLSEAGGHANFAGNPLADVGSKARGVAVADMNGDGFMDILTGSYAGEVLLLLQLPPDTDGDGVTDDVDNCIFVENPGQEDVDQDDVGDACDNCRFIANPDQAESEEPGVGQACVCPAEPHPYSQGFWHHQCMDLPDQAQGNISPLQPADFGFADDLVPCSDAVLAGLLDFLMPPPETCDAMDADPPNDPCQKAEKQLTALLLNLCYTVVSEHCSIDLVMQGCESDNVGDLFYEMADFMENGQCNQAKKCAAALNEGDGFVDPTGGSDWRLQFGERRSSRTGLRELAPDHR